MLPRVILHNAMSADGRLDAFVPDIGLYYEVIGRWGEDATLVGSETILKAPDEIPEEDASAFDPPAVDPGDTRSLLVVADSRGRVRNWHYLRQQPYWRRGIALGSEGTPKEHLDYLKKRHVDCLVAGSDRIDFAAALERLNSTYGVKVVRVDSGGTLNGVLLREGLVSQVSLLIHPCLVGGETPKSVFRGPDLTSSEGVIQLRLNHFEQLRNDVLWLIYDVVK